MKPAPHVLSQEVEGATVLLDTTQGTYYLLDDVGTRAWQLMIEHGNVDAAVAQMLGEFEVGEETLRADLAVLVGTLTRAGLVVLDPSK